MWYLSSQKRALLASIERALEESRDSSELQGAKGGYGYTARVPTPAAAEPDDGPVDEARPGLRPQLPEHGQRVGGRDLGHTHSGQRYPERHAERSVRLRRLAPESRWRPAKRAATAPFRGRHDDGLRLYSPVV